MRDLDRWKDKVELSLDGRQIFFLFFGTAVAACLVFVLGVLVGKRLEARALALAPAPVEDPLAALDQLGDADEADDGLTFHKTLTRDGARKPAKSDGKSTVDGKAEAKLDGKSSLEGKPASDGKAEAKLDGKAEGKPDAKAGNEAKGESNDKVADATKPEPSIVVSKPVSLTAPAAKQPALPSPSKVLAAAAHPVVSPTVGKAGPLLAGKPQVVTAQAAKKPDATASHFTLQLSAFPEKSDAEEFMHKIQAAGYKPFLVASEIPGKGVFYRVRVGDYGTRQAAVDAKTEFERKQRMIAYVAKL
jgi:cell division septation protein DedD